MDHSIYQQIGQNIAQTRLDLGITQEQIAEKLGISQPLYAYYEKGKRRLPIPVLMNICEILNVFVEDLLPVEKKKRGPLPKIDRELSKVKNLPDKKQKLVLDLIQTIVRNRE